MIEKEKRTRLIKVAIASVLIITALSCELWQGNDSPGLALIQVQEAVDRASPGDTIVLPAGKVSWDYKLIIRKGIILKGAGIDKTVIVNNYDGVESDYDVAMIVYKPDDFEANQPLRITGITFDINNRGNGILLAHNRSSSLTIQTRIRIDHNKFKNAKATNPSHQAILNNGMRGVVDSNVFEDLVYPIRNASSRNDKLWWDNWEGIVYGKEDNNMYYEDNVFTGVIFLMDSQFSNRYALRYNTIYVMADAYPMLDSHGNAGEGEMYSSFGGEVYGNLIYGPEDFKINLLDQRGGKFLVFMNTLVASGDVSMWVKVRDEHPDYENPTTNPQPQYINDSYFFLNRESYTGAVSGVVEGPQWSDNPPDHLHCPTADRDYFNGRDDFDGSSGVGYGPLSSRPAAKLVGVGYWATDQNIANLEGMVGKSPATPISGTLYKCTSPGVWTPYFKPYTYPHPLRTLLGD